MRSIYCSNCGSKITYTVSQPNFCSSCGTSIGSIIQESKENNQKTNKFSQSRHPSLPKRTSPIKSGEVSLADDETDIDYVPDISKLQYEIDIPKNNIRSFRDIVHEQKEQK